ncbi:hypothetical protein RZS08_18210, partial [Arthrospira platensis SPKY1]|nr:hypothetical protein [Arthrospira platensis SPKY1]
LKRLEQATVDQGAEVVDRDLIHARLGLVAQDHDEVSSSRAAHDVARKTIRASDTGVVGKLRAELVWQWQVAVKRLGQQVSDDVERKRPPHRNWQQPLHGVVREADVTIVGNDCQSVGQTVEETLDGRCHAESIVETVIFATLK